MNSFDINLIVSVAKFAVSFFQEQFIRDLKDYSDWWKGGKKAKNQA
jgi:hypothetical protein